MVLITYNIAVIFIMKLLIVITNFNEISYITFFVLFLKV